ncbi:MAG: hypothetical protein U0414_36200 [Polyangiaceae bacterium]
MDETEGNGPFFFGLFLMLVATICAVTGALAFGLFVATAGALSLGVGLVMKQGVKRRIREERERVGAYHAEQHQLREAEHRRALELAAASNKVVEKHTHVVERQVVVMRCKYCSKLTPVDLAACEVCGHQL